MQVEVVVFLLGFFSGVWSVPSLAGIATGFVSDFLHVTLLFLGSLFFLSRCIEEGKRVCFIFLLLNCSFALWYDSLRTSVYIQTCIGCSSVVVSLSRSPFYIGESSGCTAHVYEAEEQHAPNFLDDQVNNIIKSKFMYTSSVP